MAIVTCPNCSKQTTQGFYPKWVFFVAVILFPVGLLAFLAGRKPTTCEHCGHTWDGKDRQENQVSPGQKTGKPLLVLLIVMVVVGFLVNTFWFNDDHFMPAYKRYFLNWIKEDDFLARLVRNQIPEGPIPEKERKFATWYFGDDYQKFCKENITDVGCPDPNWSSPPDAEHWSEVNVVRLVRFIRADKRTLHFYESTKYNPNYTVTSTTWNEAIQMHKAEIWLVDRATKKVFYHKLAEPREPKQGTPIELIEFNYTINDKN